MSTSNKERRLQEELTAAQKTVAVLMDRVEQSTDATGDLQALLENNYALQKEIQHRLLEESELKQFNHELEVRVTERTRELDTANNQLKQKNKLLEEMSVRDDLTGLHNRRYLSTALSQEFIRAKRYKTDFSILMLDLDFFKKVNDNHGHEFGDFVLTNFSSHLLSLTRATDIVCRCGGEEFVILMPETQLQGAINTAEKIRLHCDNTPFRDDNNTRKVTVSCGVTSLQSYPVETVDELLRIADKALYTAKGCGRNNVQSISYENEHLNATPKSIECLKDEIVRILSNTKQSSISAIQLLAHNYSKGYDSTYLTNLLYYVNLLGKHFCLPPSVLNVFENTCILYHSTNCLLYENKAPASIDEFLTRFDLFLNERSILNCLNERYDGTGLPEGLQGEEIPTGTRIFTVANKLAILMTEKFLSSQEILTEMVHFTKNNLDPEIVRSMLDLILKHDLLPVSATEIESCKQEIN